MSVRIGSSPRSCFIDQTAEDLVEIAESIGILQREGKLQNELLEEENLPSERVENYLLAAREVRDRFKLLVTSVEEMFRSAEATDEVVLRIFRIQFSNIAQSIKEIEPFVSPLYYAYVDDQIVKLKERVNEAIEALTLYRGTPTGESKQRIYEKLHLSEEYLAKRIEPLSSNSSHPFSEEQQGELKEIRGAMGVLWEEIGPELVQCGPSDEVDPQVQLLDLREQIQGLPIITQDEFLIYIGNQLGEESALYSNFLAIYIVILEENEGQVGRSCREEILSAINKLLE